MTITTDPEYRRLALDSSNEMMEYDGDMGLGRYEKAAGHIREAGRGRDRMARLGFDAGDYEWAAAGWLSAADCYCKGADLDRMRACLGRAIDLERAGKIPAEMEYLSVALRRRKRELAKLERRLARFDAEAARLDAAGDDPAALDWLLGQVRDLPGLPRLHQRIAAHADRLGRAELAAEHRRWAEVFAADPRPAPAADPEPVPAG